MVKMALRVPAAVGVKSTIKFPVLAAAIIAGVVETLKSAALVPEIVADVILRAVAVPRFSIMNVIGVLTPTLELGV